ncbi:helix-turn-helix domain-containing protein [Pseudonocardia kujensis]|uniref:helix-turn-helix domain-containing protein n=1 Tax=Pseudonocardia kujensis TaxID=1128675 RepID=UPI001E63CC4B|nr:helix-turn-helix domain-containing protein [Pseudonocardia kujensis]MCE0766634.1 helix-turn-helix domain-containing protein [Pseudonocardia kujensis]
MGAGEYVTVMPHPALRRYVRRLQGYREYSAAPLRRLQAPVGSCALILGFGGPLRLDGPAGPSSPHAFLAGMQTSAVRTEFRGDQHGIQVDLTPLGVFVLLRRPTAELTGAVPALDELDDPGLAALPQRLAEDPDWPRRFARVEAFLAGRLLAERVREPDPEVAWAWRTLVHRGGAVGIAELAAGTGWGRRHLLDRFRAQVGLAPKTAARVLRFERAAGLVVGGGPFGSPGPRQDLAAVAAECGYADQAHLSREFRALAGVTPTAYRCAFVQATPAAGS